MRCNHPSVAEEPVTVTAREMTRGSKRGSCFMIRNQPFGDDVSIHEGYKFLPQLPCTGGMSLTSSRKARTID